MDIATRFDSGSTGRNISDVIFLSVKNLLGVQNFYKETKNKIPFLKLVYIKLKIILKPALDIPQHSVYTSDLKVAAAEANPNFPPGHCPVLYPCFQIVLFRSAEYLAKDPSITPQFPSSFFRIKFRIWVRPLNLRT